MSLVYPDCFGNVKGCINFASRYRRGVTSASPDPKTKPEEPAGLGRRVVAICLDWLACILLSRVFFGQVAYGSAEGSITVLLLFAAEVILFTWLMSASFGQRIMGISVVRLDGGRLSLWRIALRTVLVCCVIPALIYDSTGRGLQDRAVGSVVIRTRGRGVAS